MDDLVNGCTTHHEACACREAAHRAEVERLRRRIEHAAPWPHEGMALDEERLRALRLRWSFGPEQYQGDADALIATVLRERATNASVTAERDAAVAEVERLRLELAAERAVSASLRERLASLSGKAQSAPPTSGGPCGWCGGR